MEPWELIEKLKADLDKTREELNKFNTSYYYDLEVENKKLKETNFKLLGRLSTIVDKYNELSVEIEKLFDNWALGNYPEAIFFAKLQMLIHKLQNS